MKIFIFFIPIFISAQTSTSSNLDTYLAMSSPAQRGEHFRSLNQTDKEELLGDLSQAEQDELFNASDNFGKFQLLRSKNFQVDNSLSWTLKNMTRDQFLSFLHDYSKKLCLATKKNGFESLGESENKRILQLACDYPNSREKNEQKKFFLSKNRSEKEILTFVTTSNTYLSFEEDQQTIFLELANEPVLKKIWQGIKAPQERSKFLSLLPESKKFFFGKELRKDAYIKTKYSFDKFHDRYSINFLYIYKQPVTQEKYILPTMHKQVDVIKNIMDWARSNDQVNIWYDGAMVTPAIIEATKDIFESFKNIALKDMRKECKLIEENLYIFSPFPVKGEMIRLPIYYRADLGRAMIVYDLAQKQQEIAIYADIIVPPMSKKELFDPYTLYYLNNLGMVMAHGGARGYENGFQILSPKKPNMLNALKKAIIDPNLDRAKHAIQNGIYDKPTGYNNLQENFINLQQIVYTDYINMFKLFLSLEGWGDLKTEDGKFYRTSKDDPTFIEQRDLKLENPPKSILPEGFYSIPTKEVNLLPASLKYDG